MADEAQVRAEAGKLLERARELLQSRREEALETAKRAVELAKAGNDLSTAAQALNLLVDAERIGGRLDAATEMANQALEYARAAQDRRTEADALSFLGLLCGHRGELDSAAEWFSQALALRKELGDDRGIAGVWNNLSLVHWHKGDLDQAMGFQEQALDVLERLGDRQGIASAYLNLGLIDVDRGDWDKALESYFRALAEKEGTQDKKSIALYYNNVGEIYLFRGKLDRARFFLERALDSAGGATQGRSGERDGVPSWIQAEALGTMGEVEFRAGDFGRAQALYERDEAICRNSSDREELAEALRRRAELDVARNDFPDAKRRLEEALKLCVETGSKREEGNAHRALAELAEQEGDRDRAIASAKRSVEILKALGRNYELGCALLVLGRLEPENREGLKEAQQIFEELGVLDKAKQADGMLRGASEAQAQAESLKPSSPLPFPFKGQGRGGKFPGVVGADTTLAGVFETIERAAPTRANVLILGESGTGKEIVARSLHRLSDRHDGPYVAVNCAAIPETLLESELFGVEKGTATGVGQREGKFESANHGTIFLDEIGDMTLGLQAKVLRVLQERTFERVGGRKPIEVDVRIVAATNKNLEQAMAESAFRRDLYYRLNVITLTLPPLRERKQDVPEFVRLSVERVSSEYGKKVSGITEDCLACLLSYSWPGNIRELENVVERGVILARGELVTVADLPAGIQSFRLGTQAAVVRVSPAAGETLTLCPAPGTSRGQEPAKGWQEARKSARTAASASVELAAVREALEASGWVVKRAADRLGISRRQLYRIMEKHGIARPK
jgi:transcriptional regulator with PAS, ATPase and Fis domain/Tfp pilus assembly protein PilF